MYLNHLFFLKNIDVGVVMDWYWYWYWVFCLQLVVVVVVEKNGEGEFCFVAGGVTGVPIYLFKWNNLGLRGVFVWSYNITGILRGIKVFLTPPPPPTFFLSPSFSLSSNQINKVSHFHLVVLSCSMVLGSNPQLSRCTRFRCRMPW